MRKRILVLFSVAAMALAGSAAPAFAADSTTSLLPAYSTVLSSSTSVSTTGITTTVVTAKVFFKTVTLTVSYIDADGSGTLTQGDAVIGYSLS